MTIKQLRRGGGFPDATLDGDAVLLASGRTAYQSFHDYAHWLVWPDGDLLVAISSSLPLEELLLIANSMY
jgi:hypothetical protein